MKSVRYTGTVLAEMAKDRLKKLSPACHLCNATQSVFNITADRTRLIQRFSSVLLLLWEIDTRDITSNQALITFSTLIAVSQDVISPSNICLFGFERLLNRD